MTMAQNIQQLKITLFNSKPSIWREILVPADYTFFALHVTIQDAFGWEDCHLHQYFTDDPFKRHANYNRIGYPTPEMDDVIDERKTKLSEYLNTPKTTMFYEYDFGDSWMHEIKLEKTLPRELKKKYPKILGGANACPPDDCGGLGGYYDLLEILKNPQRKEHQDMLEWLGLENADEFKPKAFEINSVSFRNPAKALQEFEEEAMI